MNVLSLFDGMSCGQIALKKLGIPVKNYFASEIDKFAIKVAKANFPDMVHLGDVQNVKTSGQHLLDEFDCGHKIDLLIGGSPCQGFSFAGKQLNFDDPRSQLFFEYIRLLKALKPKYFMLENVKMSKQSQQIITDYLGVEPVEINSNLVSAQNRRRLYWTNIPVDGVPEDKGIVLADILENGYTDRDKSYCLDASYYKGGGASNVRLYFEKSRRQIVFGSGMNVIGTIAQPKILQRARGFNKGGLKALDGKTPTISTSAWEHNNHLTLDEGTTWRKLTPVECERLQTVPDGYTNHVSNTQRYKMLGNGWTVDVVKHLFKGLQQ
jgi:DNA-cytosine methyltransferase